jgi:hypothetical protein
VPFRLPCKPRKQLLIRQRLHRLASAPTDCLRTVQRRNQRADFEGRIGGAHDTAHNRDPGAACGDDFSDPQGVNAADGEKRHASRPRHLGETLAADFGAVTGFAYGLEGGSGQGVIDDGRIDRLGFRDGMDRDSDEFLRTKLRPCRGGVSARRQVDPIDAGKLGQRRPAMDRQTCAMATDHG